MKNTIMMLAFIASILLTWLFLGLLNYLFTNLDISFKEACTSGGVLMVTVVFGWVPGIVILSDLDEKLT
jgi:small neutral amino acid transporter SnatA (MarC family)